MSLIVFLLTLAFFLFLLRFYEYRRDRGLPPGPRRLPLIGNLHQAPTGYAWLAFEKWRQKYGPIYSVQFGKDTLVILGTSDAAEGLLNKRSNLYSNRPRLVMAGECLSKGMHTMLKQYDAKFRREQRMTGHALNYAASQGYRPQQDLESKQLIQELLSTNDFDTFFRRYSASTIYSVVYGFRVHSPDDISFKENYETVTNQARALKVGAWIVDAIPILNVLPRFLAPWKRVADQFYQRESKLYLKNLDYSLKQNSPNIAKILAASKEAGETSTIELAYTLGIMASAALETTAGQLNWVVMAALKHPDKARAVQEELDAVVGIDRMPTFEDKERLPYVNAFVAETMRWRHITPSGMPHAAAAEDEYLGYRIPKGALIVGNVWSINRDESVYEDAQTFLPERFLENPGLAQHQQAWGFGRRICPGRHIALNSLFIVTARLLWAFDIEHVYINGVRQEVDDREATPEFSSRPMPFSANLKPRNKQILNVIEGVA